MQLTYALTGLQKYEDRENITGMQLLIAITMLGNNTYLPAELEVLPPKLINATQPTLEARLALDGKGHVIPLEIHRGLCDLGGIHEWFGFI